MSLRRQRPQIILRKSPYGLCLEWFSCCFCHVACISLHLLGVWQRGRSLRISLNADLTTDRPKAKYFAAERTSIKILNFCLHSLDENRHYHQIRSAVSHQNALEFGPWRQKNAELSSNVRIFNASAPGCWNLGFTPTTCEIRNNIKITLTNDRCYV